MKNAKGQETKHKFNSDVGVELGEWIENNQKLINERCFEATRKFGLQSRGLDENDVYSQALYATLLAYNKYSSNKDCKFSTYVFKMIDFYFYNMYNQTTKFGLPIKISRRIKELVFKINKDYGQIDEKKSKKIEDLSIEKIQEEYSVSEKMAKDVLWYISLQKPTYLNSEVKEEDSFSKVNQIIPTIDTDFSSSVVKEIYTLLTDQEKQILNILVEEKSVPESALLLGVSKPTAYKIVNQIKYKVRDYYKSSEIDIPSIFKEKRRNTASGKRFEAISPKGKKFISDSPFNFGYEHGLRHDAIHHVLRGNYSHHKNWKFRYID